MQRGRLLDGWNERALEEALAARTLDARDAAGVTPLWHAVYFGRADWVTRLLSAGAALDAHDPAKIDRVAGSGFVVSIWRGAPGPGYPAPTGRSTLLHTAAARAGSPEVIRALVERGLDPNARDAVGCTPLHVAAFIGNVPAATALLDAGADPNAIDRHGYAPLDYGWSKREFVRLLLSRRGDPNGGPHVTGPGVHEWARSPVVAAASGGQLDILAALLDAGADLARHPTALPSAALSGRADAVQLLLKRGAPLDGTLSVRGRERGPLACAAAYASLACVQVLLPYCRAELDAALVAAVEVALDDNATPPNDRGPARKALVAWLLEQGAEASSALLAAAAVPDESYARLLLEAGARADSSDAAGESALVLAARLGHHRVARLLLSRGANALAHAADGRSAFAIAEESYRTRGIDDARLVMAALREAGGGPAPAEPAVPSAAPTGPSVGARVAHAKFGEGTIKALDGEKVTVAFDAGDTRTILAKFVTLKA